jgi:hypothetical protein
MEKLWSLKKFQHKLHESLWEAYMQIRRLIIVTQKVTKLHVVQFLCGILDKELR